MKILYFSFMAPTVKFGGGLGVLKSLDALCQIGDVYYIGPEFDLRDVAAYNLKLLNHKFISMEKSNIARIRNIVCEGSPSLFVKDWVKAVNGIDPADYKVVYLERTLQGFAAKWARKQGLKLVVMTHNVEADFLRKNSTYKSIFFDMLFLSIIKRNERMCISYADKVIALTEKDKKRFTDLYGEEEKYTVIPVCVKAPSNNGEAFRTENPYLLMTGSLWFGPNVEGILWFLNHVWSKISKEIQYDIVIAGKNPTKELLTEISKQDRVYIIENPESMDSYYRGAELFIAPIFDGAGMKVKIAEAMSYGLSIIATKHALIGYEAAENCVYRANESDEFIKIIKRIYTGKEKINRSCVLDMYDLNYSDRVFKTKLRQTLI